MKYLIRTLCSILVLSFSVQLHSRSTSQASDSLRISMLTCGPGEEVYSLYGHTAIRVTDLRSHTDEVYNYGVFSFNQKGFIWRFMLGETDYRLGVVPFQTFYYECMQEQRAIYEQTFLYTPEQAARVAARLAENAKNPLWTYRYNFLTDNCTTRALDMLLADLPPYEYESPLSSRATTYRDIIHRYAKSASPWNAFGQDLIIGYTADTLLTPRAAAAFPLEAIHYLAALRYTTSHAPLCSSTHQLLVVSKADKSGNQLSVVAVAVLLCISMLLLTLWELYIKKRYTLCGKICDDVWMFVIGTAGILVFLLSFCSLHPTVGDNALIFLLNPLPLLLLPIKIWRDVQGKRSIFMTYLLPIEIAIILLLGLIMQVYPVALYILAFSLLFRVAGQYIFRKQFNER